MDFSLTSEQEALRDSVRRFCEREYSFAQRRAIVASAEGFSKGHWKSFAELGWLGAGLREEAGGYGGSAIEYAIIFEEFGRALVVEPFVAHVMASRALERLASKSDLVAAMISGEEKVALAHMEAAGRGDPSHVESHATSRAGKVLLSGRKSLVLGGAMASRFLISVHEGDGISVFVVDAQTPGLNRQIYRTVDNHRVCDLSFDELSVSASLRLGEVGRAGPAIEAAIDHGTIALCAEAVGAMDKALWITRDYLKTRRQFGTTLSTFQALQHRMADMLIEVELARSVLYQGLAALEKPDNLRRAGVSAAKALISDSGIFAGAHAIQLHGGIGVTEENAVGHYYKRLFAIARLLGDSDFHRDRFMCADSAMQSD